MMVRVVSRPVGVGQDVGLGLGHVLTSKILSASLSGRLGYGLEHSATLCPPLLSLQVIQSMHPCF